MQENLKVQKSTKRYKPIFLINGIIIFLLVAFHIVSLHYNFFKAPLDMVLGTEFSVLGTLAFLYIFTFIYKRALRVCFQIKIGLLMIFWGAMFFQWMHNPALVKDYPVMFTTLMLSIVMVLAGIVYTFMVLNNKITKVVPMVYGVLGLIVAILSIVARFYEFSFFGIIFALLAMCDYKVKAGDVNV